MQSEPPFRADHVGSLLRPEWLKKARERLLGEQTADKNLGPHDNAELRAVEDECIREAIAQQESLGFRVATDGEMRRRSWWQEMFLNWDGLAASRTGRMDVTWRNQQGVQQGSSRTWLTGPIRYRPSALARAFGFLRTNTRVMPKVTLPSTTMLFNTLGGPPGIRESVYRDVAAFDADLIAAYRQELAALVQAGARYFQIDDPGLAFLCDPARRALLNSWGFATPAAAAEAHANRINAVIADLPEDATVTLHLCRGNREGQWMAEGGYDPVADIVFNRIKVSGYFLEYDSPRAGNFDPLRFLPKGKTAVLGLLSTKVATLESADELRRRLDEAARFAPLEQLCLSPQCGFSSSIGGNPVSARDQSAKLARVVEVARAVWGHA